MLLFTSPTGGQGKTTTLARLAPHLAEELQGNLLVVDANARNPDLDYRRGVALVSRSGHVLADGIDWTKTVQTTPYAGVNLLPGGNAAEPGGVLRQLRELAGQYDLVAVDAPSLEHRQAVALAEVCDAACLVVRMGEISPRILGEAARILRSSGCQLLGCVAIDAGPQGS